MQDLIQYQLAALNAITPLLGDNRIDKGLIAQLLSAQAEILSVTIALKEQLDKQQATQERRQMIASPSAEQLAVLQMLQQQGQPVPPQMVQLIPQMEMSQANQEGNGNTSSRPPIDIQSTAQKQLLQPPQAAYSYVDPLHPNQYKRSEERISSEVDPW